LLLILSLLSCRQTPPVVKVALAGPFEGQHRAIGYDAIYSARLAVREINQAGGLGPYRLALVALDDGGSATLAAEVAASLALDPAVVAVIGHWLSPTTTAVRPVYAQAGLPFIAAGERPFAQTAPDRLPAGFHSAYAAVTPFEEIAGPYAGPAYDAFYLLAAAMSEIVEQDKEINRETLSAVLQALHYEGITGDVYQPH
jgi:ABC-type branched-subunit amino acid transport system substrate-binding protein